MKDLVLKVAETFPLIQDASNFDARRMLKSFGGAMEKLSDLLLDICVSIRETMFQSLGSTCTYALWPLRITDMTFFLQRGLLVSSKTKN